MDSFSYRLLPHVVILALLLPIITQAQTAYQEIFTLDPFSLQQTCVQYCFTTSLSGCTTDVLADAIGCPYNPCDEPFQAVDDCYCRSDLQPAAESFLTSCIKESCTVGDVSGNIASASSLYAGYCTSKGFTAALPAQNTAETTTAGTSGASSSPASRTGTTSAASTGASDGNSTSSTQSSTNNTLTTALGAVGAVAGIAIIIAIICFVKLRKQKKRYPNGGSAPYDVYNRSVVGDSPSTRYLRSQVSSRLSDDAPTIFPHESASVLGEPVNLPRYPASLPSLVSTNRPDESSIGTRRNRPQF
ncbi:uncharacterized protein A1O9_04952 [Exophiala aquamarina CBS 119918]|uniref:Extracellular membrane protein CFEM domain-containing protein n=1 Tax=Exophiala aquamarina CBS 119918 TaxID=1182545 RepID=A0A072PK15_9EURO|nr:uncharacterized protein A1O9_04952 [Exophiala aquamarina CBS 119918]KEF60102.1 hypothetical protein A1O9_04952 [Exophiala aquamarina CBS 119918]